MKRFIIIVGLFCVVAVAFASSAYWQRNLKPPISLVESISLATTAVNKGGGDFYCLDAAIWKDGGQCVWYLDFGSTNGAMRWVAVGADQSVVVRKDGPFISH
jgi:hypothetical protein